MSMTCNVNSIEMCKTEVERIGFLSALRKCESLWLKKYLCLIPAVLCTVEPNKSVYQKLFHTEYFKEDK